VSVRPLASLLDLTGQAFKVKRVSHGDEIKLEVTAHV
jgi:hypothetical protein